MKNASTDLHKVILKFDTKERYNAVIHGLKKKGNTMTYTDSNGGKYDVIPSYSVSKNLLILYTRISMMIQNCLLYFTSHLPSILQKLGCCSLIMVLLLKLINMFWFLRMDPCSVIVLILVQLIVTTLVVCIQCLLVWKKMSMDTTMCNKNLPKKATTRIYRRLNFNIQILITNYILLNLYIVQQL